MPSFLAAIEEWWLLPVYSGRHAAAWLMAHRCLTIPLQSQGETRRYEQRGASAPLSVVTVGSPRRLRLFAERLVDDLAEVSRAGRQSVWSPPPARSTDADLVIVQIHRWAMSRYRSAGWRIVPSAIRWHGPLSRVPPSPPSRSLRDDLRKIRQHKYVLEADATDAGWEEFYRRMLVPSVEHRFGERAWIPSRRFLRRLQKVATLQFVCRRGERVAAFCAVPSSNGLWFPLLGVMEGDETLRREGVLAAAYGLGLDWARNQGIEYVDKGRTVPFVNDGVATYKGKWGLEPTTDPLCHLFAIKVNSAAAAEAFARSPVWIETDTGLAAFAGEVMGARSGPLDVDVSSLGGEG